MSRQNQIVAAIDIGTTKIVSIIGRKNENGKLEVLSMSKAPSKGVKRGVVQNIEETVNAIKSTIEDIQEDSGLGFSEVFVGIAGQHIKSIRNRGYINRESDETEITRDDIQRLIKDMQRIPIDVGEEIIHVLPQSFIVDHETGVKNPVGMSGRRLEGNFHIVIGRVASARNIEKCVNRVGLTINELILEPLASSEAVLTDDEKEAGVTLVDIGGGTTDVAVYYDNIIRHTAVIPFGGNVVTNDIKEGCAILNRQAESLKTQFGSALGDIAPDDKVVTIPGISGREPKEISFKNLAYIIQSRMEEIIDAVTFEIQNSGYYDKLAAGIVLTGGGALLKHLPQLVKFRTGMDVRVGLPNLHLTGEVDDDINQPMFSTSIGLVLKGFEYLQNNKPKTEENMIKKEVDFEVEGIMDFENGDDEKTSSKRNIFEKFKSTLNEIFAENGVKIE
ncbi:MAG: cell division protein FtsA [Bacteroidales bacterium]|nr:cell division protein FtsA [Bacteroidales bacterium]